MKSRIPRTVFYYDFKRFAVSVLLVSRFVSAFTFLTNHIGKLGRNG